MGVGRVGCLATSAGVDFVSFDARHEDWRRPLLLRASVGSAGRPHPVGTDRRRCCPCVAQSDPRNARGLLRGAGEHPRDESARSRARITESRRGTTMRPTALIAVNVFRESVRDKVLYNLVAFAILLIGASYLIGQLTAGQDIKIIKDLGLAATSVFGLFIAIFIGIGLVSKEVEKRSIYGLLSKPVSRPQVVLGKYAGLLLTLAVNLAVMAAALYAVLAYIAWGSPPAAAKAWDRPALDPQMLRAFVLTFDELAIVTAIALFFSTFST